ncbi:hypothetical protein OAP01_12160 [Akkermansiaceae bacterium]|nr:hypothetical protein [Akkermansiaceae bacterium]
MNQSAILIAAAIAVTVGGGYIIGNNTAGGGSDETQQSSARIMGPRANRALSGSSGSSRANGSSSAKGGRRYSGFHEIYRLPGSSSRITALAQYYQRLSPQQLEDEAKEMEEFPYTERTIASTLLFNRWGEVDAYSALDYANGMGYPGIGYRVQVMQGWAGVDHASAGKYMAGNPPEFDYMGPNCGTRSAQCIIAGEWAKQDPNGAIAWANSLEKGKDEAVSSVVREVAREDPATASVMLPTIDPEIVKGSYRDVVVKRYYRAVAESYGAKDFAAAKTWISTLPADQQAWQLAAAIKGLARNEPQAAAAQVSSMEAGENKDRAIGDVIKLMAPENPKAAAEFLTKNDSADLQYDIMRVVMTPWVSKDPQGALTYTMAMEKGDTRDEALFYYVHSNMTVCRNGGWTGFNAPPGELIKVLENISKESSRSRYVASMINLIESTDSISDSAKQSILGRNQER